MHFAAAIETRTTKCAANKVSAIRNNALHKEAMVARAQASAPIQNSIKVITNYEI